MADSLPRTRAASGADNTSWIMFRRELHPDLADDEHHSQMHRILEDPGHICFLLEVEHEPHGFIELSLRNIVDGCTGSPVCYVEGLYVAPEARGRGYARTLFDRGVKWAASRGASAVAAAARLDSDIAQRFYRHLGFEEVERTVQFLRDI